MKSLEQLKNKRDSLLIPMDHGRKTVIVFFSISFFLHGLFFYSLIFFQNFKSPRSLPAVIQIDLISFSPEPAMEELSRSDKILKEESIPVKVQTIKKKTRKIPTIKADISLKTKPKDLKDLLAQQEKKKKPDKKKVKKPVEKIKPKKQINSKQVIDKTRKKLKKKIEEQYQDQIALVLSRLQKKVKEQGKTKKGERAGASAGYGKKGLKSIKLYKTGLRLSIEQNWVFNDIFARMDQNLEVQILIKILKSGEIRDIIYKTRSGNRYLDESAKKAIKKSNPLPPLPPGKHSYDIVVGFTPKGLK